TPNPIDPMTNATSGYYPTSSALATFTNQYGFTIQNLIPPTGTNESGPFSYGSGFSETIYTNSSLYMLLYGYTAVNFAGPYAFDSLGNLTNSSGSIAFTLGLPGACPNRNGPFYSAPQYGPTSFTNSCGFVLTLTQGTNYIYAVNGISVNDNPALYTNFDDAHLVFIATNQKYSVTTDLNSAYVTMTGGSTPGANQVYGNQGIGFGYSGYVGTTSNNFIVTWVSNKIPPPGGWWKLYKDWTVASGGVSGTLLATGPTFGNPLDSTWNNSYVAVEGHYNITNTLTYWANYLSNQWSFYSATNVTFMPAPIESVSVIGNVSNIFNVSAPAIPDTNTVYTGDKGDQVTFTETNVGWWSIGPNGRIFGSSPPAYQLSFIISQPTPPGSYSVPNSCRSYLIAQISGVKKYMVQGLSWMSTMSRLSQVNPTNNFISISSAGNATVYLLGNQVYYGAWSDSSAWSTNIPNDACSYSPMGLPATFMPALTQRTMTIP
ncbi:MAG: hypothetical protein KGL39_50890, partial [Patescibacteria group bacterium]|nr:hypothetical protein [Patescibacteria group bacterium]